MEFTSQESQKKLKQTWKNYLTGDGPTDYVRPEVLRAWERCKKLNTDPYITIPKRLTDTNEINERIKKNEKLLKVSQPAIKHLYNFIAGSKLFVSISDIDGYLLLVYYDDENVQPQGGLLHTSWSEKNMGNNPIGTSIVENRSLFVIGYEHYCIYPHHYTGAGSPIHDPEGNIIGAISITGITEIAHHHTLGMVVMTAYAIERELKIQETLNNIDTAYNHRNTIIDSISEGLLVIDSDNKITFANKVFREMFTVYNESIMDKSVLSLFSDPILVDIIKAKTTLTDYVTDIRVGNLSLPCTVSYSPIKDKYSKDSILIINELSKVKKLAKKFSENKASITFNDVIGRNKNFINQVEMAKSLALTDSNILLLGESGTGKDVFAQAIHNYSSRRNGPFIPVNCGAISKELITSELFGYVEGAFTGAKKGGNIGKFELANGGTLFLDEIGEMPLDLQATLLRAIETRVINRVGGRDYIQVNVRIIAATNKHLSTEVKLNNFRQDLYYRLNILSINLIPLRDRKEDIKYLTEYFLNKLSIKYGKVVNNVTSDTWKLLMDYEWPGNIRELQNAIERAVALTRDNTIMPEYFNLEMLDKSTHLSEVSIENINHEEINTKYNQKFSLDDIEQLNKLLEDYKWNITKMSAALGVSRTTIYRKMKKFGLQ